MRKPALALAVLALAAACGGKVSGGSGPDGGSSGSSSGGGSSGGSSGGGTNSCLETSGSSQACVSCIESECGSQLSAVESGCSDLLDCECPGGVYDPTAAESCGAKGQEASCTGPAAQIDQCVTQYCESQCETIAGSSGSGSSSGGSGSGSGGLPSNCTADDTIDCSGGADGYACAPGVNPEVENTSLSCSTPVASADGEDDFCCFSGFPGSTNTCEPDDDLTAVCPDPDSYGYQCVSGDDPSLYDPQLSCSVSTPDPDGVHDDYCCTDG